MKESAALPPLVDRLSHLLLQVSDLERAIGFYVDLLGFRIKTRERLGDGRDFVSTVEGLGLTTFPPGAPHGATCDHIAFHCPEGIGPLLDRLQEAGVPFEAPKSNPYGTSVYFHDPDGNRIECHDSGPAAQPPASG